MARGCAVARGHRARSPRQRYITDTPGQPWCRGVEPENSPVIRQACRAAIGPGAPKIRGSRRFVPDNLDLTWWIGWRAVATKKAVEMAARLMRGGRLRRGSPA